MSKIPKSISQFSKKEIEHFFEHAKLLLKQKKCTLLFAAKQKETGRILIITPRVSGNAPERNKARRRIKNLFYENELFKTPYDYAIIFKKDGTQMELEEVQNVLDRIKKKHI